MSGSDGVLLRGRGWRMQVLEISQISLAKPLDQGTARFVGKTRGEEGKWLALHRVIRAQDVSWRDAYLR